MAELSERLKELRKEKKVVQKDLAKLLDLKNERTYRQYEAGTIDPPTSKLKTLADYYDVSADFLLGRSDDRKIH